MPVNKLTQKNVAFVFIDHQIGTMFWVNSINRSSIMTYTRALMRTAVALRIPVILTSNMEEQMPGALIPSFQKIAPEAFAGRVKRIGHVNCWDDPVFTNACHSTNRRHLVMSGITTDVCLGLTAISAASQGLNVTVVVDASGSATTLTDEVAYRRMARAGVELTTTSALLSELTVNWASNDGQKVINILGEEILGQSQVWS